MTHFKMNATFNVASYYSCDTVQGPTASDHGNDPIWKQTEIGCQLLLILKDLYGFNITYVPEYTDGNVTNGYDTANVSINWNKEADIYLRPMSLGQERSDFMYPVHAAYTWKFGFILRISGNGFYRTFYSKPFARPTWNCLYAMALFVSIFFYILKKWEFGIVGGWNCSFSYEILTVLGAYCQHIPPIEAKLPSRRIAYFVFLMFAYTVYTFYTSNLLSHLVNDKNNAVTLDMLATTNHELVIVDYMLLTISENVPSYNRNYGIVVKKLRALRSVSIAEGMEGVREGKMALLSDYISIFPYAAKFTAQEICETSTVDLFSNIKKYIFTSNDFPYVEHFKIGALRAKETGILKRLKVKQEIPTCTSSNTVETKFMQISTPIIVLFSTYVSSVIIMFIEREYYNRRKVWPYVD